jgi:hypothetical protein
VITFTRIADGCHLYCIRYEFQRKKDDAYLSISQKFVKGRDFQDMLLDRQKPRLNVGTDMNAAMYIIPKCIEIRKTFQKFQFTNELGKEDIKIEVAGQRFVSRSVHGHPGM